MKISDAQDVLTKAREVHGELSQLLYYAPFVFDIEKRNALVNLIQDDLDMLSMKANEFMFDQNDEENINAVTELKAFLDQGDDVFSPIMYDDIEEARLYKKRFGSPMDALREAAQVYQRSIDDAYL